MNLDISLLPGVHYLEIEEWGNNGWNLAPYQLDFDFRRAEPDESVPVNQNTPRPLVLNQAQGYKIDLVGDKDFFLYESPGNEDLTIHISTPIENYLRVFNDQTGEMVRQQGFQAGNHKFAFKIEQPTRYRFEVEEWGNNRRSDGQAYLMVSDADTDIPANKILVDPGNATSKTAFFSREPIEGLVTPLKVGIDLNGDGKDDLSIPETGEVSYAFNDDRRTFGNG